MSRGMTIADFVQQVYYAIYKVRLDTTFDPTLPQAFHADTDKFKEVVMEGNFVLQELQKDQDWSWLRVLLHLGTATELCHGRILEYQIPESIYKLATGFNDSVRLHHPEYPTDFIEVPYTVARSGTVNTKAMFDQYARLNVDDLRLHAFVVGDTLTFSRPFMAGEIGREIRTDAIRRFDELHICGPECKQPCPSTYEDKVFTEIPDPYYMVVRTAAKRAEGDPGASERVMALTDESAKILSAMRENDSSKTVPDTYTTVELGYMRIL